MFHKLPGKIPPRLPRNERMHYFENKLSKLYKSNYLFSFQLARGAPVLCFKPAVNRQPGFRWWDPLSYMSSEHIFRNVIIKNNFRKNIVNMTLLTFSRLMGIVFTLSTGAHYLAKINRNRLPPTIVLKSFSLKLIVSTSSQKISQKWPPTEKLAPNANLDCITGSGSEKYHPSEMKYGLAQAPHSPPIQSWKIGVLLVG